MKLIDKDALVAEIERRNNLCEKIVLDLRTKENKDYYQGKAVAYSEMSEFIDTLEVKEVNLEKEIANQYESNYEDYLTYEEFADIAKHFFELGLKVQKGE